MGGDGGCVANNRRFMRGAGLPTGSAKDKDTVSAAERERLHMGMTTCALSGRSLFECSSSSGVVACPYGKMYCRESAIQALIHRRRPRDHVQQEDDELHGNHDLGLHVRGMKDLFPVRLHFTSSSSSTTTKNSDHKFIVPSCPITGIELNGSVPAFLIIQSKKIKPTNLTSHVDIQHPNVISEKGIKEMGMVGLQTEYGPFDAEDMIRLVPPMGPIFDSIQEKWTDKCLADEVSHDMKQQQRKDEKKKKHTRDHDDDNKNDYRMEQDGTLKRRKDTDTHLLTNTETSEEVQRQDHNGNKPRIPIQHTSAAHEARKYVSSTVASNPILSSLFTHPPK